MPRAALEPVWVTLRGSGWRQRCVRFSGTPSRGHSTLYRKVPRVLPRPPRATTNFRSCRRACRKDLLTDDVTLPGRGRAADGAHGRLLTSDDPYRRIANPESRRASIAGRGGRLSLRVPRAGSWFLATHGLQTASVPQPALWAEPPHSVPPLRWRVPGLHLYKLPHAGLYTSPPAWNPPSYARCASLGKE